MRHARSGRLALLTRSGCVRDSARS